MNIINNYLIENNTLDYFAKLFSDNEKIINVINKPNIYIQKIASKFDYYEDALKNDVNFECNIRLRNIENKIKDKCVIHFFQKCIKFIIECEGNIIYKGEKISEIEIIFSFKQSEISDEFSKQEKIINNNYSSAIIQNNYITSIKLMRIY